MEALTPNTAAFLNSLAYDPIDPIKEEPNVLALPTSNFFPVPGRDTPEDSSPDSMAPTKQSNTIALSDDSDTEMGGATNHKRKASGANLVHDEEDGDDSLSDNAHDDKRQHNDKKAPRRKSSGENNKKADKAGTKDSAMTKAQRRKEQNRAAQKAFRERREAKVRDLEQKVAELEAKSFGASVENENLRNILKRLQEENVALKQASFTFSMPMNGQASAGAGQQQPAHQPQPTSVNGNANGTNGIDWSQFTTFKKPPSPPISDTLRSINEPSPQLPHRNSSTSNASPESLLSLGPSPSSDPKVPTLFNANGNDSAQAAYQEALKRQNSMSKSPNDQLSTPSSIGGSNKDDLDALVRSLYPNGIDNVLANMANASPVNANLPNNLNNMPMQMPQYTWLTQTPGLTSQADGSSNAFAKLFGDATSYRDTSSTVDQTHPAANNTTSAAMSSTIGNQSQWADLTDNSVNDFLSSLSGNNKSMDAADLVGGADDEAFSRQLEALIAQSGGVSPESAFNLAPSNAFSPTNYLNMSPSPLNSLSNSQSPRSGTDATSPQSDIKSPGSSVGNNACASASKVIHVLSEDGRVMRPSEVWTRMGMHESDPQDLLIDDLCDQMKSKATCKDGRRYMKYDDVQDMMRRRAEEEEEAAAAQKPTKEPSSLEPAPSKPLDPALDPDLVCEKDEHGEFDPIACQAKLNEAFLKQNGLAV